MKCIYLGEEFNPWILVPEGIHIHLARSASLPDQPIPSDSTVKGLQNQLFSYRSFNLDRVKASEFTANDLLPQFDAVARQLGAAIVADFDLQHRVVELLKQLNDQARVDRSRGLKDVVLRAVLSHCHSDQQRVFTDEIAATVNRIYREEGESLKVRSETVGHVLKNPGLYSRRLGSAGRGLVLDTCTQFRAHALSLAYEVLPGAPECGALSRCPNATIGNTYAGAARCEGGILDAPSTAVEEAGPNVVCANRDARSASCAPRHY